MAISQGRNRAREFQPVNAYTSVRVAISGRESVPVGLQIGRWTVIGREFLLREKLERWAYVVLSDGDGKFRTCRSSDALKNLKRINSPRQRSRRVGSHKITHGETRAANGRPSPEFKAWLAMRERCRYKRLVHYAGRGISVCERWEKSFIAFLEDMGRKPSPKHSLDRIDVNGNYEPGNCRWATQSQQNRNRRDSKRIAAFGKEMTPIEWSEQLGVPTYTIARRIKQGWSAEDAVSIPTHHMKGANGLAATKSMDAHNER